MMHGQCCLNKIEPYIVRFFLFLDLTNLCFLFTPAQMSAEQKDLGGSAMGDGEKTCPCCQFYGVPCRQVRATEDEV